MKVKITTEKWNQHRQPTSGGYWCIVKNKKKIWFHIIEQGWTKDGVYLKLSKN
jgi:hypothetical protein